MMSDERYQELYPVSDENFKSSHKDPADDILNSLADCITVHRIPENKLKAFEHLLNEKEIHTLKTAELDEKKNLAEDYEAIVKKQLQLLQADERGRVALEKEIEDIKRRQQNRSEALKARKKALLIEKARAKKMASRPSPLPRSVIKLLKEQERKEVESNQNVLLPLQNLVEDENENFETDENVLNEEEMEERRKIQEMRDKKAKIRFNEAIKKERQNKENVEILKEIQNAEKINRRHLAKTISSKGGSVPCQPPDKIFHSSNQITMENKVERIFKQNPKEHAVEDIEGYEDRFEAKYKEIDSNLEARLIDCVPSFVKENYNYLLQDESTLQCGRRFTGFQSEEDPMNMGFIASPPLAEDLEKSKEVEDIINVLNQMHRETNEMIEKDFKPLLNTKYVSKVESIDKAVEVDILKMPTEHKSIEVGTSVADHVPHENRGLMSGGVMGFKRRPFQTSFDFPGSARKRFLSPPRAEDIGKTSGQESWSSSSYWSLPSKHGMPKTCNLCDSPTCRIPLVEHGKTPLTCIPLSKSQTPSDRECSATEELVDSGGSRHLSSRSETPENNLSHYVRMVAEKYLKGPREEQKEPGARKESEMESEVFFSTDPGDERKSFEFEYAEVGFRETASEENPVSDSDGCKTTESSVPESRSYPVEAPLPLNMDAEEDSFLQKCNDVISDNLLGLFSREVPPAEDNYSSGKVQTYSSPYLPGRMGFHELSTIQEMDSALTNDSYHTKRLSGSIEKRSCSRSESKADGSIDTTPVSLIEDPPEELSKLAMSIKFTEKKSPLKPTAGPKDKVDHESPNTTSDKSQPSSYTSSKLEGSIPSSLASKFASLLSIQTGNLSSCSSRTPSTVSTQASPMSEGSLGVPYAASSPFKGQPGTLISLPKYFPDLSSIRKGSSSSASSVTGVSEEKNQAQYSVRLEEKQPSQVSYGLGSFAPMSLYSGVSSPSGTRFYTSPQAGSGIGNQAGVISSRGMAGQSTHFQAMTPLSHDSSWQDLSAQDETPLPKSQRAWRYEQEVPPTHFDQGFGMDEAASAQSPTDGFYFLTPHTYLPSLTESYISNQTIPSQREFYPRDENEFHSPELTNPFDFDPKKKMPTSGLKSQFISTLRNSSKGSSSSLPSNLSLSENKSFTQNNSPDIVLRTDGKVCKPTNIKLNFHTRCFLGNKHGSESPDEENVLESANLGNDGQNEAPSPLPPTCINDHFNIAARNVGSEVFIPTLTEEDLGIPSESSEATQERRVERPALKSSVQLPAIQKNNYHCSAVSENGESPFSQNKIEFSDTPPCISNFPSPLLQVLKNNDLTGSPGQLSSQHNTPCRSTFQTPSKTLEEMMMETGILNEPDLTLVNSEFTINPNSPEKQWNPENNQSCPVASIPSEMNFSYSTPVRNPVLDDACDSPSMLSFLKHEQSCFLAQEPISGEKEMTKNQDKEKFRESPRSAKKRTPWQEYKSRTKRLWNNLEEVKEKKLLREKKEEMLKNRMKMKAYSKKLPATKK